MIKIIVKTLLTGTSPEIEIYEVRVEDEKSEWPETFGSKEALTAFIHGVKAGASMCRNYQVSVVDYEQG